MTRRRGRRAGVELGEDGALGLSAVAVLGVDARARRVGVGAEAGGDDAHPRQPRRLDLTAVAKSDGAVGERKRLLVVVERDGDDAEEARPRRDDRPARGRGDERGQEGVAERLGVAPPGRAAGAEGEGAGAERVVEAAPVEEIVRPRERRAAEQFDARAPAEVVAEFGVGEAARRRSAVEVAAVEPSVDRRPAFGARPERAGVRERDGRERAQPVAAVRPRVTPEFVARGGVGARLRHEGRHRALRRAARDELDDAAERAGAVERRAGAFHHLDALDLVERQGLERDRLGVRSEHRHAIDEQEDAAARAVREARRAADRHLIFGERHAGHDAQHVVEAHESAHGDLLGPEHRHAGRHARERLLGARGRHDDLGNADGVAGRWGGGPCRLGGWRPRGRRARAQERRRCERRSRQRGGKGGRDAKSTRSATRVVSPARTVKGAPTTPTGRHANRLGANRCAMPA